MIKPPKNPPLKILPPPPSRHARHLALHLLLQLIHHHICHMLL